jgi:tetratricopeptide (TPR) repeat protein
MEQSFSDFRELHDLFWQARSYARLGFLLARQAKLDFREVCLKSLELARAAGERLTLADALTDYADWLVRNNQADKAREVVKESDQLYKELGSENIDVNSALLAEIAWMEGDTQKSRSLFMELRERCNMFGETSHTTLCTANLGLLALEEGELRQAQVYLEQALDLAREMAWKLFIAFRLAELSHLFYLQGEIEKCKQYLRESLSLKDSLAGHNKMYILMVILGFLYTERPEVVSQLLGAIAHSERHEVLPLRPVEKRAWGRIEAYARQSLGAAAFEAALAQGQKLTLNEALGLALKTVEAM